MEKIKVAMMATNGFEEDEMVDTKQNLEEAGIQVDIVSDHEKITAWDHGVWSNEYDVDVQVKDVNIQEYDALVLPGGVINPDKLRRNKDAVKLVKDFYLNQKLIAAICHGPQMLIEADLVKHRKMTSYHSIAKDMINAGADWIDEQVVEDGNFITSRNPGDIEAFSKMIIERVKEKVPQ